MSLPDGAGRDQNPAVRPASAVPASGAAPVNRRNSLLSCVIAAISECRDEFWVVT